MGKYDKGKGWDLVAALEVEKEHFRKLHEALQMKSEMDKYAGTDSEQVEDEIELLLNTIPPQVQQVWDNLNLRTKHRFLKETSTPRTSYLEDCLKFIKSSKMT